MKQLALILAMAIAATSALAQPRTREPQRVASDEPDRPLIDVTGYAVQARLDPEQRKLAASVEIAFKQLDRKTFATLDLDRRLKVTAASVGGKPVRFRQFDLDSTVEFDLSGQQFSGEAQLRVEYAGILNPESDRQDDVLAKISEDAAFLLYDAKWYPTNGLYKDPADFRLQLEAPPGWSAVTDLRFSGGGYLSTSPGFWGLVAVGKYTSSEVKTGTSTVVLQLLKADSEGAKVMAEATSKMIDFYSGKFGPLDPVPFQIIEVEGVNWNARWSANAMLVPASQLRKDFDQQALARNVARQWFPLHFPIKDASADAWLSDGMAAFSSFLYFESALSPAEAQEVIEKGLVKALAYEGRSTIKDAGGLSRETPEFTSLVTYKGAYVLRMLRWTIGDEKFDKLLAAFVDSYRSKPVDTAAFTQLASKVSGEDLSYFFDQWLNSSGVPEFQLEYTVFRLKQGYKVMGQIKQDLDLFKMPVEIQIQTDGEPEYFRVDVSGPSSDFDVVTERKPKAIVIDPRRRVLRLSNDIKVSVFINRGEEEAAEGRYNQAIDEFQKAIDLDKHNSLALFRMGEALFELGNLQAASNVFLEALNGDLKPKWVEVWAYLNRGKIFDIRGQRERAVTEYQKAVNTGDDAYGAQAEAQKYVAEPFRRSGKPTIGN